MRELTKRQHEVYSFIERFIAENRYPPTIREVSGAFHISVKGAYDHIESLQKKGWIRRTGNRSRSLELLARKQAESATPEMISVPILGDVAAGLPVLAEENVDGRLDLPASMLGSGQFFGLRVRGESMIEAGIHSGDLAVIRRQDNANNSDIVVALLGDSATLKRFFREKNRVRLQAANPDFPPIYTQEVRILGKLAHVIRSYS